MTDKAIQDKVQDRAVTWSESKGMLEGGGRIRGIAYWSISLTINLGRPDASVADL